MSPNTCQLSIRAIQGRRLIEEVSDNRGNIGGMAVDQVMVSAAGALFGLFRQSAIEIGTDMVFDFGQLIRPEVVGIIDQFVIDDDALL